MVSDRERAQLILIGAILIATIIFGLSVLLNSLVFTGASGGTGAEAALGETDLAGFEIQRNVRAVIVRVNHANLDMTGTELGTRVEANVTRYSRLLAESKAASGSVAVNVSYNNSTSEGGWRIVQALDADFSNAGGDPEWLAASVVPDSPDTTVGWFTANVDVDNTTSPFFVRAEDENGNEVRMEITRTGVNNSKLSVVSERNPSTWPISPPPSNPPTCESSSGRVLLDLYHGSGFVDGCQFLGIDNLTGPVSIDFSEGDNIRGKYEIVVNRSNSNVGLGSNTYERCSGAVENPCVAPVIWSANLTTRIDGDGLGYENSYNLSLYAEET